MDFGDIAGYCGLMDAFLEFCRLPKWHRGPSTADASTKPDQLSRSLRLKGWKIVKRSGLSELKEFERYFTRLNAGSERFWIKS